MKKGIYLNKKTGNYVIRWQVNGKDKRKVAGSDKKTAELMLHDEKQKIRIARLAEQYDDIQVIEQVKQIKTFKQAAESFLYQRSGGKESSLRSYKSIFNKYLLPKFGDRKLNRITEDDLRDFLIELTVNQEKPLSKLRANLIMQPLRYILRQAYREGQLKRDPSMNVGRMKEAKAKIDPFSPDELKLALSHVSSHFRPFFTAQAYTGCRPNELLALRWNDIDWTEGKEQISISKGRVRGIEAGPKTESSNRLVPITQPVKEALLELRSRRGQQKIVCLDDNAYVFIDKNGNPIDHHLDLVWKRALNKANIRYRPAYQLRHSFISQRIEEGFPLPFIAKLVGHTNIETLIKHYARQIDKHTQDQEQKLRDAFTTKMASQVQSKSPGSPKKLVAKLDH
jgi:integrase